MTLKQAIEENRIEEFIKEHELDEPANKEAFLKVLQRMEDPSHQETDSQASETYPEESHDC